MKTAINIFAVLLIIVCTSTTLFAQMRGDVNLDNYVSAPDQAVSQLLWRELLSSITQRSS